MLLRIMRVSVHVGVHFFKFEFRDRGRFVVLLFKHANGRSPTVLEMGRCVTVGQGPPVKRRSNLYSNNRSLNIGCRNRSVQELNYPYRAASR